MKNITAILVLISLFVLNSSCKKNTILPTQAEVTANELQTVISKNNIHRVIAWGTGNVFPNSFPSTTGTSFSFSNGFITIAGYGDTLNLSYLESYNIANVNVTNTNGNITGTDQALILNFKW